MPEQWVTKLSFQHLQLDFLNEKGEIRIKEEKSRLPGDVRGSKTSLLKFPINNFSGGGGAGRQIGVHEYIVQKSQFR